MPMGLIAPSSSQGKMVHVVCRGRPVISADVKSVRLVRGDPELASMLWTPRIEMEYTKKYCCFQAIKAWKCPN